MKATSFVLFGLLALPPALLHAQSPGAGAPDSAQAPLPSFIPPITAEDRETAFPNLHGHAVHDNAVHSFVLFDQVEWRSDPEAATFTWQNTGWIGRDLSRLWFRTEGGGRGRLEAAEAHVLYGRAVARWWEVVAGVRQDLRPGPARTWAAFGVQGVAPYWFEVELTGYVGTGGQTQLRLETEYDLLLTNRLVLQPLVEFEVYGRSEPERGIGAGLASVDVGVRLRYELRREFAPYVGVLWNRAYFGTADFAAPDDRGATRMVAGGRFWF